MFIELVFFLSFLFDFFTISGYGRIIDIFILSSLPIYLVIKNCGSRQGLINYREFIIWLLIFAISSQSLFSRDYRSVITICSLIGGFTSYLSLRYIRYIPDLKTIKRIGYLIISIEFIETILYYWFSYNLNLTQYFGDINNRGLNESISLFRPSSIYQEPNQLSIALFFILALTIIVPEKSLLEHYSKKVDKKYAEDEIPRVKNIFDFITNNIKNNLNFLLLVCFSMILSASLWGFLIASIYLIIFILTAVLVRRKFNKFNKQLYSFLIFFGLTIIGFVNLLNIKVFRNTYLLFTTKRLNNLENDPSAIGRYSIGNFFNKLDTFSLKEFLIGNGASTSGIEEGFQYFIGANGYSFLLYSIGFIGIFLLLSAIFVALARYKNKSLNNFIKMYLLIICFLITLISTYPFFTYAIFWIWLSVSVNCSHFYLERSK